MKRHILWLICSAFLAAVLPLTAQTIKVACIGDSITQGFTVVNPAVNAYPIVLGRLLGPAYQTVNFGVGGTTLLRNGDSPYWNQSALGQATNYAPDIVTIMLGTNDSKPQNWIYKDQFAGDLSDMIDLFANLPSHPKVFVCIPVPAYAVNYAINPDIIKNQIIPIIKAVAKQKGITTIDLYTPMCGRPELFADNIHPNAAGDAIIARVLQGALIAH